MPLFTMIPEVERVISGRGLIRIPEEFRKARNILLYVDLVRPAKNLYVNYEWSPNKSFYAHVSFCWGQYVLRTFDINFERQVVPIFNGQPSQNLLSLICATGGLISQIGIFASAQGVVVPSANPIKTHGYESFECDEIRFDCYSTTALRLLLKASEFDRCNEDDGSSPPPPPPPAPPPRFPADTPISVSPPYDDGNDDGGTVPADGDEFDEFPPTEACTVYQVTYSYDAISGGNTNRVTGQIIRLYGEIGEITTTVLFNGDPVVLIECQGVESFGDECGDLELRGVATLSGAAGTVVFDNATIDAIV